MPGRPAAILDPPRFNNLQDSNIATLANNFLSYFPRTRGECDACVINLGSNFAKLRLKVQNRRRGGLCSYETEWPADQAHASFHLVTNAVMFEIDKRMQEFQNIFTLCWFMNCFFFTVSACNLLKADVKRLQQNFGYLSKSIIMRNLPICCQFLLKFCVMHLETEWEWNFFLFASIIRSKSVELFVQVWN